VRLQDKPAEPAHLPLRIEVDSVLMARSGLELLPCGWQSDEPWEVGNAAMWKFSRWQPARGGDRCYCCARRRASVRIAHQGQPQPSVGFERREAQQSFLNERLMNSFTSRYCLPRMIDIACGMGDVMKARSRMCPRPR